MTGVLGHLSVIFLFDSGDILSTRPDSGFAVEINIPSANQIPIPRDIPRHRHFLFAFLLLKYLQRTVAHSKYSNTRKH